MLRAILKGNHKSWDEYLSHIEFAYNRVVHKTTKVSPFEVIQHENMLTRKYFEKVLHEEQPSYLLLCKGTLMCTITSL